MDLKKGDRVRIKENAEGLTKASLVPWNPAHMPGHCGREATVVRRSPMLSDAFELDVDGDTMSVFWTYPDTALEQTSQTPKLLFKTEEVQETSWFRFFDGKDHFETPMPEGKGWEVVEHEKWKEGECLPEHYDKRDHVHVLVDHVGPPFYINHAVGHETLRCWLHEFGDRGRWKTLSVLEAKRLRRTITHEPPQEPYDYHCASKQELKGSWPESGRPSGAVKVED